MSSQSGKKLSNAKKKANRKLRARAARRDHAIRYPAYIMPPASIPGHEYFEYYSVIFDYIVKFLKSKRSGREKVIVRHNSFIAALVPSCPNMNRHGQPVLRFTKMHFKNDLIYMYVSTCNKWGPDYHHFSFGLSDPEMMDRLDKFMQDAYDEYVRNRDA